MEAVNLHEMNQRKMEFADDWAKNQNQIIQSTQSINRSINEQPTHSYQQHQLHQYHDCLRSRVRCYSLIISYTIIVFF